MKNAAVLQILRVTERHPHFLQQWAHEAWNIADGQAIKAKEVLEAHNNAISGFLRWNAILTARHRTGIQANARRFVPGRQPQRGGDLRPSYLGAMPGGKPLIQADISVSLAKALNELECPQEWPTTDETERHDGIAPAKSGKEHLDAEHVKVEVFAKPNLLSIAEMERFFETCDAYRGNEGRFEVGGFKLWV